MNKERLQRFLRFALAGFFVVAGSLHFLKPAPYLAMMPPYLPWPEALIMISGAAEILGGLGILLPPTRHLAGWSLILLLIAVFPANVQVALHGWPGTQMSPMALWWRLPFQLVFMAWVYWTALI